MQPSDGENKLSARTQSTRVSPSTAVISNTGETNSNLLHVLHMSFNPYDDRTV